MLYQLSPALFFYKLVSGVIGETMGTMASGAGRYRQCTQFTPLILKRARYQYQEIVGDHSLVVFG